LPTGVALASDREGIAVTLPKPVTSGDKSADRSGKQDFAYLPKTISIIIRPASD